MERATVLEDRVGKYQGPIMTSWPGYVGGIINDLKIGIKGFTTLVIFIPISHQTEPWPMLRNFCQS